MNDLLISLILILVKLGLIFGVVLSMAAYLVLAERKILGRMQMRYGPNRIGPGGMIQPLDIFVAGIEVREDHAGAGFFHQAHAAAEHPVAGCGVATQLCRFAVTPEVQHVDRRVIVFPRLAQQKF